MHAIQTQNLCLNYENSEALADVTCCIQEGDFVAILGPNGSGKSSFLKVVLGLIPPTSGLVRVFDQAPGKTPAQWLGYVPQIKTLDRNFPALAHELVISGLRSTWQGKTSRQDRALADAALALVGAGHLAEHQVGTLSGGELQRIYLARSLARKPRLVLLDEPVTGIDTVGETDFYRVLEDFRAQTGATILMVTHDWEVASNHALRVMVLNHRIIRYGNPAETLCPECLDEAYGQKGFPPLRPSTKDRHV